MGNQTIELASCVTPDLNPDEVHENYDLIAWDSMILETDATWHLQGDHALPGLIPYGRMRFNQMRERDNLATNGAFDVIAERIESKAGAVAKKLVDAGTPFDMVINYPVLERKVNCIEIPKTVKKGWFRRETVYEKQTNVVCSYSENSLHFNGWRLAHFGRVYKGTNFDGIPLYDGIMNWDFVLGSDGKIYHVTYYYNRYLEPENSGSNGTEFSYTVRDALFYDPCVLNNTNQAYFLAVTHGAVLTLNNVLPEVRDIMPTLTDSQYVAATPSREYYIFNFPTQPPVDVEFDADMRHLFARLDSLGAN